MCAQGSIHSIKTLPKIHVKTNAIMTGVEVRMDGSFGEASRRGPSLATEPSSTRAGQSSTFQDNVKALLGGNIALGGTLTGGIDLREGYPHATTGITKG